MHRVLSFQMARGFGESSEFVTKRMCFSFLFSVGFLCLLCGFLTGRFAAGRAVDMRTEKTRLQLAGNGLENEEHLRELLVRRIHESPFTTNYSTSDQLDEKSAQRIKSALEELQFFQHVVDNRSCIAATVRGTREPDRYVILSAFGEGVTILVELCKALKIMKDDFDWNPRRSLFFLISLESGEACRPFITHHVQFRVVSYIELNVQSISANGYFVTTGSDIVQSTILQASAGVNNPMGNDGLGGSSTTAEACRKFVCAGLISRTELDIPNALVTFLSIVLKSVASTATLVELPLPGPMGDILTAIRRSSDNSSSSVDNSTNMINAYRRGIGEVIATSVWRLSEMTLFKWDPREENANFINILESLNSSVVPRKTVETIVAEVEALTRNIGIFNEKLDRMETTQSLEVRIANDLSMQARRVLLCNDKDLRSRTARLAFDKLNDDPSHWTQSHLNALFECYKMANQLLEEDIT